VWLGAYGGFQQGRKICPKCLKIRVLRPKNALFREGTFSLKSPLLYQLSYSLEMWQFLWGEKPALFDDFY
jgi:hypothetical protein